ncbi:hypothetical protein BH20ACT2_BH20ACT2_07530 [soil metagenome]
MSGRVRSHRVAAMVAGAALLAGLVLPVTGVGAQAEREDLRQQYDEVVGEEAGLLRQQEALQAQRAKLLDALTEIDQRLADTTNRLAAAEADLDQATAAYQAAKLRLDDARRRLGAAEDLLNAQAVSSYIRGGDNKGIELMLDEVRDNDAGKVRSYAGAVVDHQSTVVRDFLRIEAETRRRTDVADEARDTARAGRNEVAVVARRLQVSQAQQKALSGQADEATFFQQLVINDLQGRKAVIESRIVALSVESDSVGLLLRQRQLSQPDWVTGAVAITSPLDRARVSSEFGMRTHPIIGTSRLHAGMDMSAPSGTPIRAAAPGLVLLAGPRGGYGNTVVLDHDDTLGTLYAHQSRVAVEPGDRVEAGDVVGFVGSTGLSTGPHLHFETRLRGVPTNPRNLFRP